MPFGDEGPRNLILLVGKNTGQAEVRQGRLETARRRAEADSASKRAVLAQTSHEIRTPLNIVFGMIDLALDQDLPKGAGSYLTVARSAARTLLSLLDDFLEFSKLESGKLTLRESLFSPKEVLEEACAGLELLAGEKNLQLHLMMESALPEQLLATRNDFVKLSAISPPMRSNTPTLTAFRSRQTSPATRIPDRQFAIKV
jgi:signal transduction histidine kinase